MIRGRCREDMIPHLGDGCLSVCVHKTLQIPRICDIYIFGGVFIMCEQCKMVDFTVGRSRI
jgi:hypothetical protein